MKEEPALILRPNIINAFFPTFLKIFFKIAIYVGIPLIILDVIVTLIKIRSDSLAIMIPLIIGACLILSILLILLKIFVFFPKIEYRFYKNHMEVESKLFKIEKKSLPYSQITNIDTQISLWDRITYSGDLIIHTADEKETGDIHLLFLKNPIEIEKQIHLLILKTH